MLIFGERHLRTVLAQYEAQYNGANVRLRRRAVGVPARLGGWFFSRAGDWALRSRVMTGEAGREESGQVSEPGEETGAGLAVIEAMSLRQSRLIAGYDSK